MKNPYKSRRNNPTASSLNSSVERYRHFIRTIIATQNVWGLYDNGWAIGATSHGVNALPVWPEKSLAQLCQAGMWTSHQPTSMTLENFIFKMLPYIVENKMIFSIMMTPDGQSVFMDPKKLLVDIKAFLYDVYSQSPDFFKQNPNVPLPRKIRINEL